MVSAANSVDRYWAPRSEWNTVSPAVNAKLRFAMRRAISDQLGVNIRLTGVHGGVFRGRCVDRPMVDVGPAVAWLGATVPGSSNLTGQCLFRDVGVSLT